MKPLGVAIIISTVICVVLVARSETVHLYTLIHWPAAILVLGVTLGVLMAWQPPTRWRRFLAFLSNRPEDAIRPINAYRLRSLNGFLTAASRSALIAGLAGEFLGIFMILAAARNPAARNPAAMEPGISIATVSLLYGLLLSVLVFQRLRKRIAMDMTTVAPTAVAPTAVAPTAVATTAVATTAEQSVAKLRPHRVGGTRRAATS